MDKTESKKPSLLGNLTVQILISMLLGAILGIYIHNNYDVDFAKEFSDKIKILATIFIRLVQMIIAPLVFTTLVVGIAKLGDIKTVGRIGGKSLGLFFSKSTSRNNNPVISFGNAELDKPFPHLHNNRAITSPFVSRRISCPDRSSSCQHTRGSTGLDRSQTPRGTFPAGIRMLRGWRCRSCNG